MNKAAYKLIELEENFANIPELFSKEPTVLLFDKFVMPNGAEQLSKQLETYRKV